MKLFRFGDHGREKLGAVRPDGSLGDASGIRLDCRKPLELITGAPSSAEIAYPMKLIVGGRTGPVPGEGVPDGAA